MLRKSDGSGTRTHGNMGLITSWDKPAIKALKSLMVSLYLSARKEQISGSLQSMSQIRQ